MNLYLKKYPQLLTDFQKVTWLSDKKKKILFLVFSLQAIRQWQKGSSCSYHHLFKGGITDLVTVRLKFGMKILRIH